MSAPVTAIYASICAVLIIFLAYRVVVARRRARVGLGDGGDAELAKAVRAHANCVEYVPFALGLMLLWELNGAQPLWLHVAGASLIVARLLHGWGLSHRSGVSFGRFWGTAMTWLLILTLAGLNLFYALT